MRNLIRCLRPQHHAVPRRRLRYPSIEALEDRSVPTVFLVNNANDSGPGSLRQACLDANRMPAADAINFTIPIVQQTKPNIKPTLPLPALADPVIVDGTTEPGYTGPPLVLLTGGKIGGNGAAQACGLVIA